MESANYMRRAIDAGSLLLCIWAGHGAALAAGAPEAGLGPLGLEADRLAPTSQAAVMARLHRKRDVILQAMDNSCAAAALANYLTYSMNRPTTEAELLAAPGTDTGRPMSAADIRRMAAAQGVELTVYSVGWRRLRDAGAAAGIVRIRTRDNDEPTGGAIASGVDEYHFVMLEAIAAERVHLKDPVRGNISMSHADFLEVWRSDPAADRGYLITSRSIQ